LPIINPAKDIILGCYYLTGLEENVLGENKIFASPQEAIMSYQLGKLALRAKIKVMLVKKDSPLVLVQTEKLKKAKAGKAVDELVYEVIETTCGRVIFNQALPSDFPFVNELVNSKKLSKILSRMIEKYSQESVQEFLDKIKELGFEYSTESGISWGMDDLIVPKEKPQLLAEAEAEVEKIKQHFAKGFLSKKEKSVKLIEVWQRMKEKIEKLVPTTLPKDGPVFSMIDSGARGSWAQPVQMAGMKGLVTSPSGRIIELPIKHSFKEGFDVLEYFISTHGARKGTADTALRTSASGYLTRRLVDVAHNMIIFEEDCGDTKGWEVFKEDARETGQDFRFKIVGRIVLEDLKDAEGVTFVKANEFIGWEQAAKIDQTEHIQRLRVRSPLTCQAVRGLCQQCYGWEMGRNAMVEIGAAVGIVAAQSIGEPGTQLTMRTFHMGGVSGGGDITRGLPRVEEVFEARSPKGEGVMVMTDGIVKEVDLEKGIIRIQSTGVAVANEKKKKPKPNSKAAKKEIDILEYRIPAETEVYAKKGDVVKSGQALCQGSLDLKKLFKVLGQTITKRYIMKEIQRIYASEGIDIHEKHLETIVKQMFARVRIVDQGDGPWVPGQIVSSSEFGEINQQLEKAKKQPAKAKTILLGITRVALTSDSFLSSASFQETSRVLIRAALEGREDKLMGLKENVMIGRLIPAGTGFRK